MPIFSVTVESPRYFVRANSEAEAIDAMWEVICDAIQLEIVDGDPAMLCHASLVGDKAAPVFIDYKIVDGKAVNLDA